MIKLLSLTALLASLVHFECYGAIIGFDSKCRAMAPSQGAGESFASLTVESSCGQGVVEWHYPQFDEGGLKITWPKGSRVCILHTSVVDLLDQKADIGSGGHIDLSGINQDDPSSKVCVGRETGDELSLKFHSDVRTYVQWIEYSVE